MANIVRISDKIYVNPDNIIKVEQSDSIISITLSNGEVVYSSMSLTGLAIELDELKQNALSSIVPESGGSEIIYLVHFDDANELSRVCERQIIVGWLRESGADDTRYIPVTPSGSVKSIGEFVSYSVLKNGIYYVYNQDYALQLICKSEEEWLEYANSEMDSYGIPR